MYSCTLEPCATVQLYSPPSHFCCHSSARMPDLVSEVDSDSRAARASRAWTLPGSGARARASGFGGRAQPAARRIMSHGHWNHFGRHPSRQPARIQHRIHASIGKFHACSHACMTGCLPGWLQKLFQWPCDMMRRAAGCARRTGISVQYSQNGGRLVSGSRPTLS